MSDMQFTPVETGDMSEIPPDAPEGEWKAQLSVKKKATKEQGYPMLQITAELTEAYTEGNEDAVGSKVSEFLVFFPATHNASRMGKIKLKNICENLGIEVPNISAVKSWDDLEELIAALDGAETRISTTLQKDKQTGEERAQIKWVSAPSMGGGEEEEEEKPAPKKSAKPAPKKGKR